MLYLGGRYGASQKVISNFFLQFLVEESPPAGAVNIEIDSKNQCNSVEDSGGRCVALSLRFLVEDSGKFTPAGAVEVQAPVEDCGSYC